MIKDYGRDKRSFEPVSEIKKISPIEPIEKTNKDIPQKEEQSRSKDPNKGKIVDIIASLRSDTMIRDYGREYKYSFEEHMENNFKLSIQGTTKDLITGRSGIADPIESFYSSFEEAKKEAEKFLDEHLDNFGQIDVSIEDIKNDKYFFIYYYKEGDTLKYKWKTL
jgi:hypothetical protein